MITDDSKTRQEKEKLKRQPDAGGISVIVGLAAGVIFNNTKDLKAREQTYLKGTGPEADIADEEARRKTLEERKKYVTTDRYIKEVAKGKARTAGSR